MTREKRETKLQTPTETNDPRLAYQIKFLQPTARGLRACRQLNVKTVGEFLQRDQREFTSLRNCGKHTYDDLAVLVHRFLLEETPCDPSEDQLAKPLLDLIHNPRAERAFLACSVTTVGEFLNTPKEELLSVHGFGERSYWAVAQRIREVTGNQSDGIDLLPKSLQRFSLGGLGLEAGVHSALLNLGISNAGELLRTRESVLSAEPAIGEAGVRSLKEALDRLVREGIDRTLSVAESGTRIEFQGLVPRILSMLNDRQRAFFCRRVGLECRGSHLEGVARQLELGVEAAQSLEEEILQTLRRRAPSLVTRLHEEAGRELHAFDGIIHADKLAPGSLLWSAAKSTGEKELPLRLLKFCFPSEFYCYADFVSTLQPTEFRKFRRTLHQMSRPDHLPVAVSEVVERVKAIVDPVPVGLMMHLLKTRERLVTQIDPKLGEILHSSGMNVADRLAEILEELQSPTPLEELGFHYRDRHGHGSMNQLLDHMRKDSRFLEVSASVWDLRRMHLEDLMRAREEANTIAEIILAQPGRQNIQSLHAHSDLPDQLTYMIIECLRHDPRVRHLGKGVFCRHEHQSAVMREIKESMHRAMGEVVLSRFLDNQHPRRRRLSRRLLSTNRSFIEPTPDRIDLLTNYPFDAERLARLVSVVDSTLEAHQGYAHISEIRAVVNETDLGGGWLSEHMLLDLLRRNSDFELLPGGLMARAEMGLAGWIQHRVRECLRQAETALSPEAVLAESPDLAAFADCLEELLDGDPMVQSPDGIHYAVV